MAYANMKYQYARVKRPRSGTNLIYDDGEGIFKMHIGRWILLYYIAMVAFDTIFSDYYTYNIKA